MHALAKRNFDHFAAHDVQLVASSYVLLETLSLLQRRVGMEAVWDFSRKLMPLFEVVWVNDTWQRRVLQRLHVERHRTVSLTDCLSFEIMEVREITTPFTFDAHFPERGFEIAAFHDTD